MMIFTLCKHASNPPDQRAKTTICFVYIAYNFNNSLKCHLFIPHTSTYIRSICTVELYTIFIPLLERDFLH